MSEYLTVAQVAEMLDLCEATIRRMAHKGILPVIRLGRTIRFERAVVEEHLRARVLQPGQAIYDVNGELILAARGQNNDNQE